VRPSPIFRKETVVCQAPPLILRAVDLANVLLFAYASYLAWGLYKALPANAAIPMKYGLNGEITWSLEGSTWIFIYPGIILLFCTSFLIMSCGIRCVAMCMDSCCCKGEFGDEPSRQKDMVLHYFARLLVLSISVVIVLILTVTPDDPEKGTFKV